MGVLVDLLVKVNSFCIRLFIYFIHNNVGLEKNNDCARRNYFSSNHLDPPKEIIVTEARLNQLAKYKREKRKYEKKSDDYWQNEIYTKRIHLNCTSREE